MGKSSDVINIVLECLSEMSKVIPMPFETPYAHVKRMRRIEYGAYSHSMRELQKRGTVSIISKNGQKFLKLTRKGELQILLEKACLPKLGVWDGKWRLVVFDIPEDAKDKRFIFRRLLKRNNFYKLQASVYISPYALNREAVQYLEKSGLINYIRILRVDEMDNDGAIRKRFGLK